MDQKIDTGFGTQIALFGSGWIALSVIGTVLTLYGYSFLALICVAAIGLVCSVVGFGSLEMPLAMVVFTILGSILFSLTDWAWIAPMAIGGFMVSVVVGDLMEAQHENDRPNVG